MASNNFQQNLNNNNGSNQCLHHGLAFMFYCEDDGQLVCAQCVTTTHKRHSLVGIDDTASRNRFILKRIINEVKTNHIPSVLNKMKSVDDKMKNNSENIQRVVDRIQHRGQQMKQDIDRIVEDFVLMCRRIEQQNSEILSEHKQSLNYISIWLKDKMDCCAGALDSRNNILSIDDMTKEFDEPAAPSLDNAFFTDGDFPIDMLQEGFGHLSIVQEEPPMTERHSHCTNNQVPIKLPQPTDDYVPATLVSTPLDAPQRNPQTSNSANESVPLNTYSSMVSKLNGKTLGSRLPGIAPPKLPNLPSVPALKTKEYNPPSNAQKKCLPSNFSVVASFKYSNLVSCIERSTEKGLAWVTCFRENFVSLIDQEGVVRHKVTLGNKFLKVCDISVSPVTGNLWICCNNNAIYENFNHGSPRKCFTTENSPWCLCVTTEENVAVGTEHNVSVFSTKGDLLYTTKEAVVPHHLAVCSLTGNIAVCDKDLSTSGGKDKPHISVFDSLLNLKFKYYGPQLPKSSNVNYQDFDVVFDSRGYMWLTDGYRKLIRIIDGKGKFLSSFNFGSSPRKPRSLTLMEDGHLFVGFDEKVIKVIKYDV